MNKYIEIPINDYPVLIDLAQGRTKPKVACLGPEGTYTEAARHEFLGKYLDQMHASFLPHNAAIVQEVKKGRYDLGIVAIENSTEGDVAEVIRELKHTRNITILGETILPIKHMLIGWPEANITAIHSHPQALAQCRTYLLENYPQIKQEPALSTAEAVQLVKNNKVTAAIASRRAAEVNNLSILAEDIGDIKGNSTRFLMLGRGETNPTSQDSTSFIFIPKGDRPGILARCLTSIASYGINLTKIDSRPTDSGIMRQYAFWIILDGHIKDDIVKLCLKDLKETLCSSLRILGSYRKAILPEGSMIPGALNGRS